eukprot:3258651-Pyramimonas_sp.AAC.1
MALSTGWHGPAHSRNSRSPPLASRSAAAPGEATLRANRRSSVSCSSRFSANPAWRIPAAWSSAARK